MQAKKALAGKIVADFHSVEAAAKAAEDWAKQFQKDQVPEELEIREISLESIRAAERENSDANISEDSLLIRVDKLLRHAGLAASNTEGAGKVKEGAVSIDGKDLDRRVVWGHAKLGVPFVLRVGRRIMKVVIVQQLR
jgi:tyrosyl-tRNA synthetase